MPNILRGNEPQNYGELTSARYDYDYPDGLDLKPGSETHEFIKDKILEFSRVSYDKISRRYDSWGEIDRTLTVFMPSDEAERRVKQKDSRKPVSIVFPYSYVALETLLTYLTLALMNDPIFRYQGVSPEDTIGAILLEKVIAQHCERNKVALALHTQFRDALAYGIGVSAPGWEVTRGKRVRKAFDIRQLLGLPARRQVEDVVLFEGNSLSNIDPYRFLPDPNWPIQDYQKGEFIGYVEQDHYNAILREEQDDEDLFNGKYVKHVIGMTSTVSGENNSRREDWLAGGMRDTTVTKQVDRITMYVDLIPKDWKLGDGEFPEKWVFSLVNDTVLIKARPVEAHHEKFPLTIMAPEFDGYSVTPISRIETLQGMQGILDWLFNSHIANVRKAVNDMIIYDPYLVNSDDLKDDKPGKLVRMRRAAWGRGVGDSVKQLVVNDITRANIQDASFIVQWMQKISGADESMMGALRGGGPERLTKAEFQGTRSGSMGRLERMSRIMGMQGMKDIGYMFASTAQQLMTKEDYVKVSGRWMETLVGIYGPGVLTNGMKISPEDLWIDYDVQVSDGSVPGGENAEVWARMFNTLVGVPQLSQDFDIPRVFKHIITNMGVKNAEEFVRIKVQPDAEVQQQVQAGNMVPMDGVPNVG